MQPAVPARQFDLAVVGIATATADSSRPDALASGLYDSDPPTPPTTPPTLAAMVAAAQHDAQITSASLVVIGDEPGTPPPGSTTLQTAPTLAAALAAAHATLTQPNAAPVVIADMHTALPVAVVVTNRATASQHGQPTYAVIAAVGHGTPTTATATLRAAYRATARDPADTAYLEVAPGMLDALPDIALAHLHQPLTPPDYPTCAIGSLSALLGQPCSALAALVHTVLALHRRYIPAVPASTELAAAWQQPHHYRATRAHPWQTNIGEQRTAAASLADGDDRNTAVVLHEAPAPLQRTQTHHHLHRQPTRLYVFAGNSADDLHRTLDTFAQTVADQPGDHALADLAHRCYVNWKHQRAAAYTLVLVAANTTDLHREIERAREGISTACATGDEWKTPAGSHFTPQPLGRTGKVAFVYPGAFNAYVGLTQNLLQLYPHLYAWAPGIMDYARSILSAHMLYPRSITPLSSAEVRAHESAMLTHAVAMLEVGTGVAVQYTAIMRDGFGLQPDIALGYSQGETTMMHALQVWESSPHLRELFASSDLYTAQLAGPQLAVRNYWQLPPAPANDAPIWANYILMTSADKVRPLLTAEPHVFLAIINSPREVMIAGDPAACERVIAAAKCRSLRAPFNQVIHSPPVQLAYNEFVRINTSAVAAPAAIQFYSAANHDKLTLTTEQVATSLATVFCQPLDFPRLVQQTYADGARIFIELGPARNCTHWIEQTLHEQPHVAVAINKKGTDDHIGIVRLLARLLTHQVPLDPAILFAEPTPPAVAVHARTNSHSTTNNASTAHTTYLQQRTADLRHLHARIQRDIARWSQPAAPAPATGAPPAPAPATGAPPPPDRFTPSQQVLLTEAQVYEFTLGSVVACMGDDFARFATRRTPRTPNTDLRTVSRVVSVEGTRGKLAAGSRLVSEFDIPADSWFFRDNSYPTTPYAMLMEMAMQPCGYLSAYLGSALLFPDADLYFRNLDGSGHLLHPLDLRGRTITQEAVLHSSTYIEGIIIQKYSYRMLLAGEPFFSGESVFGYFTAEALRNQNGLDNGTHQPPWYVQQGIAPDQMAAYDLHTTATQQRFAPPPAQPHYRLPTGHLALLDRIAVLPASGKHGLGYVYAERTNDPTAWFYPCHFYQDPVMPGSLGREGIVQALHAYILHTGIGSTHHAPRIVPTAGTPTTWKYRGQITPQASAWALEAHITHYDAASGTLLADASIWRDGLRIYEFRTIGLTIEATEARAELAPATGQYTHHPAKGKNEV